MKTTLQNKLKLAFIALCMLSIGAVSAQQTTGDVSKAGAEAAGITGYIKVIDNKGTQKFLQAKNGITILTDATPAGGIVSTWQLGGTLTDDTFIDASGAVFAITGISAIDPTAADAKNTAATVFDTTGYTLMVRDEATGETKKLLMTDLIDVLWAEETLTADKTADFTITATGMLATTNVNRVSVYRNGAKLRAGKDYEITTANKVDIKVAEFVAAYTGDVFEVHYIK